MREVEIDMLEILIDRIMEEVGNGGHLYRTIRVKTHVYYVIAGSEDYLHLYQITTDYPSIKEFDGTLSEDPFEKI